MTDSDMCPAFFKSKEEIKLEPFDLESNGGSPRSNCNLNNQLSDPLRKFSSNSDEVKETKTEFKIEESEINLTVVKEEVKNNDMLEENIPGSASLKRSKKNSMNFQCHICGFKFIERRYLKPHMLVHKDPSEIKMFKCFNCSFEAKRKGCLVKHMIIHKNLGDIETCKCNICPFQTKRAYVLKNHLNIIHNLEQDQYSESKALQCPLCPYKAMYKSTLQRHSLVHNSKNAVIYECSSCDFKSIRKDSLKSHLGRHKDTSELQMFKCELCDFESIYKNSFQRHVLVRHDFSAPVYKCESCNFTTKDPYGLKYHANSHKDKSEVKSFESSGRSPRPNCSSLVDQFGEPLTEFCSKLEEEKEINLTLVTEEVEDNSGMSEQYIPDSANLHYSKNFLKNFECSICDFRAVKKDYLKKHMITHQDPSEIKMFKCPSCPYEGKRKIGLKEHMLVHKDPEDLKMFKCNICPYESKRKRSLERHLKTHNLEEHQSSESEAQPFQCPECPYKAKFKSKLKSHSLEHKSATYKCNWCSFNSQRKHNLKRHINRHHL